MTEQADLSTRTPALTISDSPNERKPVWVKDQGLTLLFEPANTESVLYFPITWPSAKWCYFLIMSP